jgi:hypothetical protein
VDLLNEAFRAVQRNIGALLFYICFTGGMSVARLLTDTWFESLDKETISPLLETGYPLLTEILLAAGYALALSVVFARMGREIDQPFWKVDSDWEALRRFFNLWFILVLLNILLANQANQLAADGGTQSEGVALYLFSLLLNSLLIQIGGAIMFYGHVQKEEIGQAFTTLLHQFPRVLLAALVSFFFTILVLSIMSDEILPKWATPTLQIIDGYGTCLVFAFTWLICMRHRDEESEDEDFDF